MRGGAVTAWGSWLCLDWLENRLPGWALPTAVALCALRPEGGGSRQMSWDLCPGLHWAGCADHGAQGCCHAWPSRERSGSLVRLLCTELGGSTVSVGQA